MYPHQPATPAPRRRPFDVLGLVSVIVAALVLVPSLLVFVIGLVPDLNAIWWLGIVLLPLLALAGAIALVLGVVGIIVARRRSGRFVLSVVGIVLGAAMLLPLSFLFFGSAA